MSRDRPDRKRKHAHLIYFSDAEETMILERMKAAHFNNFSDYIRHSAINVNLFVVDDSEEIKAFTYELNKIGVNINQIAHKLNSGEMVSQKTIDELKDMLVTIWQFQRYILSGTPF